MQTALFRIWTLWTESISSLHRVCLHYKYICLYMYVCICLHIFIYLIFKKLKIHFYDPSQLGQGNFVVLKEGKSIYIYIVIHRQTVLFYHNSSVWLDTQDARSRDWNPSNFTLDCVSDHSSTKRTTLAKGILRYFYFFRNSSSSLCLHFFIPYRLPECSILSKSFALC